MAAVPLLIERTDGSFAASHLDAYPGARCGKTNVASPLLHRKHDANCAQKCIVGRRAPFQGSHFL